MKTIPILVSDCGMFGTPVNPYAPYSNKQGESNYILFAKEHPKLHLTTPQTPNTIVRVLEESIWLQRELGQSDLKEIDESQINDFARMHHLVMQAYRVIDTPKVFPETIEQVTEWEERNKVIGNPDINFPVEEMFIDLQKRMANSEPGANHILNSKGLVELDSVVELIEKRIPALTYRIKNCTYSSIIMALEEEKKNYILLLKEIKSLK